MEGFSKDLKMNRWFCYHAGSDAAEIWPFPCNMIWPHTYPLSSVWGTCCAEQWADQVYWSEKRL